MSLMLRQACQPALDKLGLNKLHVEVGKGRTLTINTPCGFIASGVSAITFSRESPYKAEIEYAVVLLEDYLTKNLAAIKAIMKQKFFIKSIVPIPRITPEYEITIPTVYNRNTGYTPQYDKANIDYRPFPHMKVICDGKRNIIEIRIENKKGIAPAKLPSPLTTPAELKKYNKILDTYLDLFKQEKKLDEMVAALNTCNF